MTSPERPPTNYRQARRHEERVLLILVIATLLVVGPGLIGLIWGWGAALTSFLCLFTASALIAGLWLLLVLIERLVGE